MGSCKKNIDNNATQIKLNAMNGYRSDSSPNFNAKISNINPIPYERKPSIRGGLVNREIMFKLNFVEPIFQRIWPIAVKKVQQTTKIIALSFGI